MTTPPIEPTRTSPPPGRRRCVVRRGGPRRAGRSDGLREQRLGRQPGTDGLAAGQGARAAPCSGSATRRSQAIVQASGLDKELAAAGVKVEWANISGGPQTLEAFRADAARLRRGRRHPAVHSPLDRHPHEDRRSSSVTDPLDHPSTSSASRPASTVTSLADLARQEDRLQPRPGTGRAGAAGAAEGGPDQGGRQAGRAAQHRRRLRHRARQPARSTSHRSAVLQIKRYEAKYGRTAPPRSRTGMRDDAVDALRA